MAHSGKSERQQETAIIALLQQPTVRDAAKQTGIGERTLWRWLKDDEFQEQYRRARREAVSQAVAQLQQSCGKAVKTLAEVMADTEAPASSRVSAARSVLEMALKAVELEDLETRIEELEKAMEERIE